MEGKEKKYSKKNVEEVKEEEKEGRKNRKRLTSTHVSCLTFTNTYIHTHICKNKEYDKFFMTKKNETRQGLVRKIFQDEARGRESTQIKKQRKHSIY